MRVSFTNAYDRMSDALDAGVFTVGFPLVVDGRRAVMVTSYRSIQSDLFTHHPDPRVRAKFAVVATHHARRSTFRSALADDSRVEM